MSDAKDKRQKRGRKYGSHTKRKKGSFSKLNFGLLYNFMRASEISPSS